MGGPARGDRPGPGTSDSSAPVLTERVSFIRAYWLLIPLELRRLARIRGLERFILATARERRDLFLPPALTDPTGIAAQ